MKPGPAISVLLMNGAAGRAAQIMAARSRGFLPALLARIRAILLARSPWLGSRVRSIVMSGRVSAGNSPAATSASSACWISCDSCSFIYGECTCCVGSGTAVGSPAGAHYRRKRLSMARPPPPSAQIQRVDVDGPVQAIARRQLCRRRHQQPRGLLRLAHIGRGNQQLAAKLAGAALQW